MQQVLRCSASWSAVHIGMQQLLRCGPRLDATPASFCVLGTLRYHQSVNNKCVALMCCIGPPLAPLPPFTAPLLPTHVTASLQCNPSLPHPLKQALLQAPPSRAALWTSRHCSPAHSQAPMSQLPSSAKPHLSFPHPLDQAFVVAKPHFSLPHPLKQALVGAKLHPSPPHPLDQALVGALYLAVAWLLRRLLAMPARARVARQPIGLAVALSKVVLQTALQAAAWQASKVSWAWVMGTAQSGHRV